MALPLGLTLGDPAGVGPEVAARVLSRRPATAPPLLLIGTRWALEAGARAAGCKLPPIQTVSGAAEVNAPVALLDLGLEVENFAFGRVDAGCGEIAVRSVEWAARACLEGALAGMVTCPIHKEAIHAAGYVDDIGHQEILARLSGTEWTATMLMTPGLRVVHLSTHKSLIEAARYVTRDNVLDKLRLTARTLSGWGLADARIAVAALNPHGGEGGLLGREEIDELQPAVQAARQEGFERQRPVAGRLGVQPGHRRRVRCGAGAVSRPGPHRHQGPRFPCQHHGDPGDSVCAHLRRPRHRLRHCRPGQSRPAQPDVCHRRSPGPHRRPPRRSLTRLAKPGKAGAHSGLPQGRVTAANPGVRYESCGVPRSEQAHGSGRHPGLQAGAPGSPDSHRGGRCLSLRSAFLQRYLSRPGAHGARARECRRGGAGRVRRALREAG